MTGQVGEQMAQSGEPSVEEILESIKRVIARDNRTEAFEVRKRRDGTAERDVAREATPPGPALAETPSSSHDDGDGVLDLTELDGVDEPVPPEAEADVPLVAAAARDAMQENLAALAMMAIPGARPQIVRSGETSLEGLTRELLRPMLAEWLEANLPAMVERMVQTEIARIVGKRP